MMFGSPNLQAVVAKAADILGSKGATDAKHTLSSKELVSAVRGAINAGELSASVSDSTILQYISVSVNNDPECPIASGGSWGGYWLKQPSPSEVDASIGSPPQPIVSLQSGNFKEDDLYPLMEFWLANKKDYMAKDLSNLKGGGKWGNPDIVGVSRTELFGAVDLETASCEVKLSSTSWEYSIFEAISHKRFSNRSWYCYRVKEAEAPLPLGMEYYAERYKVGVIQIVMSDHELDQLKQ